MAGIKIIVAYDKSSEDYREFLAQQDPFNEHYVPIMGGKALGDIPEKFSDMQGDDTGENLSELNPYICEMSQLYWAWKHLNELGNPDHIGLCHYRRIIIPWAWTYHGLSENEMMINVQTHRNMNLHELSQHNPPLTNEAFEIIESIFTGEKDRILLNEWKYRSTSPRCNIFFMDINEFNRFMQFVERVIGMLDPIIQGSKTGAYQRRAAAYILEFVNGFYFEHATTIRGFHRLHFGASLHYLM